MWNKSGAEFAAYIPFYPDCMTSYISDTDVADKPIRIFHGTPDDYNPVAACKKYIERLRAAGFDDRGILQITLIASWFNYINRVADALGVGRQ